jgi:hypothetical protein
MFLKSIFNQLPPIGPRTWYQPNQRNGHQVGFEDNVEFRDNHGLINATKEYDQFSDALDAINELAGIN